MLSFGRRDALEPEFGAAVRAAAEQGFQAIHRVGGGRAAVFHEDTILFGHAVADPAPGLRTRERFAAMAEVLRGALARLGVRATIGELPGEYCPGAFSLHAGGVKLAGIAQRVVPGGAWTEGVVVVRGGGRVRDVLVPVYRALGLTWDARTAGALDDFLPGVTFADAAGAVREELAARFVLREEAPDEELLAAARARRAAHDAGAGAVPRSGRTRGKTLATG
jgi:lipoate-protein ligase A